MALACCILGKFLEVVCHRFPLPLDIPTFAARCLHVLNNASAPSSGRWNCGQEWSDNFAEMTPVLMPFRDLLHAANQRRGANSFTSLLNEGLLRIFSISCVCTNKSCIVFRNESRSLKNVECRCVLLVKINC
jgi:hypothetical protein